MHLHSRLTTQPGGSIIVKQVGHAILTVALPSGGKEEYLITLPRLRIDGLWYGSPYIELVDASYIQGSNGWQSVVGHCLCRAFTSAHDNMLDRVQGQGILLWNLPLV